MSNSLNRVCLIGRVGGDPKISANKIGKKIVSFSLATSAKWKDHSSGEAKERIEWHQIVIFNENYANIAAEYLHKGSQVYVQGELQTRKWEDKQDVQRSITEIVLKQYSGRFIMLAGGDRNKSNDGIKQNTCNPKETFDTLLPF